MKIVTVSLLVLVMVFCISSLTLAAGWDTCKACHTDSGKIAPSKADLTKKFKTTEELIKAAKETKNPMMTNFKGDDLLKEAAKDLGLK